MTRKKSTPNLQVNKTWIGDVAGVRGEETKEGNQRNIPAQEPEMHQDAHLYTSQPIFRSKVKPKVIELPLSLPRRPDEQTRWNWNFVAFLHEVRSFVLEVHAEIQIGLSSIQAPNSQGWIVGFVQNFISERLTYKFEDSDERTIVRNELLLDQIRQFNEPWLSPEQHPIEGLTVFDTFDVGSGSRTVMLTMNDVPYHSYNHYRGGNRELGQLERVAINKTLGLWIMARPVNTPAQDIQSYVIVSAHLWSLTERLSIIRGPQRPYHINFPEVELGRPKYSFDRMKPIRNPKLTGPIANIHPWADDREILAH